MVAVGAVVVVGGGRKTEGWGVSSAAFKVNALFRRGVGERRMVGKEGVGVTVWGGGKKREGKGKGRREREGERAKGRKAGKAFGANAKR